MARPDDDLRILDPTKNFFHYFNSAKTFVTHSFSMDKIISNFYVT